MKQSSYIQYSDEQLEKIGNTVLYLSQKIEHLSKTKLLKLLYILDELSIKKHGIPFLNLNYKVWKFGPVAQPLFVEFSSELTLLKGYVEREFKNDHTYISPKDGVSFNDDEFSDNDIELLNYVIAEFGKKTKEELIAYTHRENSPWFNTAKNKGILDLLLDQKIAESDVFLDLSELVAHNETKKEIYLDFIESH